MNERIRELAEQAKVTVLTTHGMENVVDGCYVISPAQLEKFAELIVRECCDIFVELRTRPADLAVKDVKKHFEVEESKEDSACPLCGEDGGTTCGMTCCEYRS